MKETGLRNSAHGADEFGLKDLAAVYWNLPDAALVEHAIAAGEGKLVQGGAFCAETGVHTGRSPKDKFVVADAQTEKSVWWEKNGRLTSEKFQLLFDDFIAHARGKTLFAQDLYGGADPRYRIRTRVYNELAWHSMFIRALLIRPDHSELSHYVPDFTILSLPSFKADPKRHGVRTETVIALDFTRRIILIGGTSYAGEMKKSVFTTLNYYLPAESVMPMHCSANVGPGGDVALFFGLSGTGKTTLSADPKRTLIGDDEHGWGPQGVFNFEGGCYAKVHQAFRRGGAGDLRDHATVRHRAGKRGVRSGNPRLRFRRRVRRPKIPAQPIRSNSFRMRRAPAVPACRPTSCF